MDLLALADFNLVAKHGGFGRAARAAARPKATLSRRVAELEAALGLRLFDRGARDLKLTEEGRALFERTAVLLSEIDETANAIAFGGDRPRGPLRVSAPLLFAQIAMGKLAAGFALAYSEVRPEVTADDREVDMIEEGYDLVIRVNPRSDESLVGRAFLHDRLVVVAAPGLSQPADGAVVPAIVRGPADPDGLSQGHAGCGQAIGVAGRTARPLRLAPLGFDPPLFGHAHQKRIKRSRLKAGLLHQLIAVSPVLGAHREGI